MDLMNWVAGGAAIGLLASCWGYIKGFAWKAVSLVIQRTYLDPGAYSVLLDYLLAHHQLSAVRERLYECAQQFSFIQDKHTWATWERLGGYSMFFWYGKAPFMIFPESESDGSPQVQEAGGVRPPSPKSHLSSMIYIRGSIDLDALLLAAHEYRDKREAEFMAKHSGRFSVQHMPEIGKSRQSRASHMTSRGVPWYQVKAFRMISDISVFLPDEDDEKDSLDALVFPPEVESAITEARRWLRSRDWYREHQLTWKRGWLLHGVPGVGKTSVVRAMARDLDLPLFVFHLGVLNNDTFIRSWNAMLSATPCIALIEDIDNVFHGRENVVRNDAASLMFLKQLVSSKQADQGWGSDSDNKPAMNGSNVLQFDIFLNTLDGIEPNDGVFTIITTNDISKVDEALGRPTADLVKGEFGSSRPGRIDRAIELTYITQANKERLARKLLTDCPVELAKVLADVRAHPDRQETPAQFQERCAQLALASYWNRQEESHLLNGHTPVLLSS